ncbi:MAG: hypothetical protein M1837_000719 [Sclerophora amabilis]|nr:MAG: hypothetical protein M1837_000719 [Sclerophora amabilis]
MISSFISTAPHCRFNLTPIAQLSAAPTVEYAQHHIRARSESPADRKTLALLDGGLRPTFSPVNVTEVFEPETCGEPIELPMPRSSISTRKDASSLVFGMATTVERLRRNHGHMRHWMSHSKASIVAVVEEDPTASDLEADWRREGIQIAITTSDASFQDRLIGLLNTTYSYAVSNGLPTEWVILTDDDTFFPSIPRLLSRLARYDHREPFYIGGLSEPRIDFGLIGCFAFGGGGMVFSMPLIEELAPHVDDCIKNTGAPGGDWRIGQCVYRYTRTRLTTEWGLHQLDLTGDIGGLFESGFSPLSLHHWRGWKGWKDIPMDKVGLVSPISGSENLFNRWASADGQWIFTNGFSIVQYADGIRPDMSKMELTFNGEMEAFEHALGPFRPKLEPDEEKTSYLFVHALEDDLAVRQYYAHHDGDVIDRVIELVWLKDGKPYQLNALY